MDGRLVVLVVSTWLCGCGASVPPATTDGSSGGQDVATSSTGASAPDSERSSGVEIPPPPVCDATFDSGLARGEVIWTQVFPNAPQAWAHGVAVSKGGEVFAVGSRDEDVQAHNGWYLHLAADGVLVHEVVRDLEQNVEFQDVALMPAGNTIVVGYEREDAEEVMVVQAITPAGAEAWRHPIDLGADVDLGAWPTRVAVSSRGRIVVGVNARQLDGSETIELVELSEAGERVQTFAPPPDAPEGLVLRDFGFDDTGVLYAGAGGGSGGTQLEWVGRWDAAGTFLSAWLYEKDGARVEEISPRPDGVVILGVDYANEDVPYRVRPTLRRYDAAGAELWFRILDADGVGDDVLMGYELATDCRGHSLVYAPHSRGGIDHWLLSYDEQGLEVERRILDTDVGLGEYPAAVRDIATDPFGNIVLAMDSQTPGGLVVQKLAR